MWFLGFNKIVRNIKLFIANSLDNFIARENGDVDWLFTDVEFGWKEFYDSLDTVLMGRKTLEKGQELGQTHYQGKQNYVFSRSLKESKIKEVEYVAEDVEEFIKTLKEQNGKDIWLVGGGDLVQQFLDKKLIDEIDLFVHPILLGKGIPLFLPFENQIDLKLANVKTFDNGIVNLSYTLK